MNKEELCNEILSWSDLDEKIVSKFNWDSSVLPEDFRQDLICNALKNSDKVEKGTNIKGWLYTNARNTAKNKYSRAKRIRSNFNTVFPDNIYALNHTTHEDETLSPIIQEEIYDAIKRLPPACKQVLLMRLDGMSNPDIAKTLKIPLGTAKSRLHLARKTLKNIQEKQNAIPEKYAP